MPTMPTTQPATQRLDVEDDHQREARLGAYLTACHPLARLFALLSPVLPLIY